MRNIKYVKFYVFDFLTSKLSMLVPKYYINLRFTK